jgi:hypothetical protein
MKKFYAILSSVLLLLSATAYAQTNVSGFINSNTTWTLAGSPYIVTGNALLSQGFTLTIDPGVIVKFGTNNALQIDGELIAIGTPTQRIIFTSNQANPQAGDWAKLHFSDFSVDATYDAQGNYVSGTILKYCDILYAGSLMFGSLDIQQCSPYINHCDIRLSSFCGINFNGDDLTVDSTRITDCTKRGVYFQGAKYTFRNDTFISCAEGAIHAPQLGNVGQSRITGSYFRWNYGVLSGSNSHVTIINNTFVYNAGPAVLSIVGGKDTVSCNRFRYNANGPVIESQGTNGTSGIVIHNNLIEYNVNSMQGSWNGASVFYIGAYGIDTVFISNNTIRHNSSPGHSCCALTSVLSGTPNTLQIYNNVFTENDGESFLRIYGPQTNDPSFDFMYLNGNTFINPLCTYELYNSVPYGSPNFFIDGNYWGTSNTSYVDGVLYDYFDFANQSVIYYMPILAAPVQIDTACQPFQLPLGLMEYSAPEVSYLQMYPNPTSGNISISFTDENQSREGTIELLNSLSQVVWMKDLTGDAVNEIQIPDDCGVYFVRVSTKDKLWTGKIVKQ